MGIHHLVRDIITGDLNKPNLYRYNVKNNLHSYYLAWNNLDLKDHISAQLSTSQAMFPPVHFQKFGYSSALELFADTEWKLLLREKREFLETSNSSKYVFVDIRNE